MNNDNPESKPASESANTTSANQLPMRRSRLKVMPNIGARSTATNPNTTITTNTTEDLATPTENQTSATTENNNSINKNTEILITIDEAPSVNENDAEKMSSPTKNPVSSQSEQPESPLKRQVSFNEENSPTTQTNTTPGALFRVRNRFPRAQPNIGSSSGLERIRRLSGHYPDSTTSAEHHHHQQQQHQTTTDIYGSTSVASPFRLADQILSPKPATTTFYHSLDTSPLKRANSTTHMDSISILNSQINASTTSFKQFISNHSSSASQNATSAFSLHSPAVHSVSGTISQPATPYTPLHSVVYDTKFPKEQIKNVIKYIAMQKLKKIESETLKERRISYKKYQIEMSKTTNLIDSNAEDSNETNPLLHSTTTTTIDRSKLRMRDFLYYTPKAKKPEEIILETLENLTDASATHAETRSTTSGRKQSIDKETVASNGDDMDETSNDTTFTNESISSRPNTHLAESAHKVMTAAVVEKNYAPQLKFSEDGQIIINEESLVIHRENIEPVYDHTVVENDHGDNLNYNSYRKHHHTKKWTERETAKFYKALSMIGTDFTMIQRLFPSRGRDEIKRKFKREEKLNQALIDKILSKTDQIELSIFVSSSSDDESNGKSSTSSAGKKGAVKRRKLKEKDTNFPAANAESDVNKKAPKLKRVRKREFVGSDSEKEDENSSKKTNITTATKMMVKSKQFISDDSENSENTKETPSLPETTTSNEQPVIIVSPIPENQNLQVKSPTLPTLPSINSFFHSPGTLPIPISPKINNTTTTTTTNSPRSTELKLPHKNIEEEKSSESDSSDGEELVLDLDTNSMHLSNHNNVTTTTNANVEAEKIEQKIQEVESSSSSDDEDDNIILDLDSNTFIKNNVKEVQPSRGKSSITITKMPSFEEQK